MGSRVTARQHLKKKMEKLPQPIRHRADELIDRIDHGAPMGVLGGKYLHCCRKNIRLISAPIGKRYRILLLRRNGGLDPVWIGSHEEYNNRLKQF